MSYSLQWMRTALAAVSLSLLSLGAVHAAPTLSITGAVTQAPGSNFTLNVVGADFSDLYAYQFDVSFDASKFKLNGVGEGPFLLGGGTTFFDGGTIDNVGGKVSVVFDSLLGDIAGVKGTGTLAYLSFSSIGTAPGGLAFDFGNVIALDSTLSDIAVRTEALSVAPVPEPSTWWMLAAGVGCVGVRARKRVVSAAMRS